jgi:hypothetical protein
MGNKNPGGADGAAPRVRNGQSKKSSATNSQTIAATQAVYNGRECIGRIACRGKLGFVLDGRSLGTFKTLREASRAFDGAGR